MKKLIIAACLPFVLSGCLITDAFLMAKWDNNEYGLANDVQTQAQLGAETCSKDSKEIWPYVSKVYANSLKLRNYSAGIKRNEEASKMANELVEITKGLRERYTSGDEVSEKYCQLKFNNIESSAALIKKTLGSKPR
jgi:hypothetical protein